MAFKKGIFSGCFVVILALCSQEVVGQNSTSVSPSPTASSPGATATADSTAAPATPPATPPATTPATPTASQSVGPSVSPSKDFETKVNVLLEVEECNDKNKNELKDAIDELCKKASYDYKGVDIHMANNSEKCVANITIKFGKNLNETDIIEKFKNAAKSKTIKGTVKDIQAHVDGANLGEFKASDEECKKCCDSGGPFKITATCTPENMCKNYMKTKEVDDCDTYCGTRCDGAMFKLSLLVLVASELINLFLKE